MSTINIVRYYFHAQQAPKTPARLRRLVALAYQTARDKDLHPKAVFIRSEVHSTTTIDGVHQEDPKGDHVTISYKTEDHLGRETHITCHGYVKDPETLEFREATHADEKPDSSLKHNKKPVWPENNKKLWEAPEVGYGHMD